MAAAGKAARTGLRLIARVVSLITMVIVGILIVGILLVVLGANESNDVVKGMLDVAETLAGPFHDIFKLDGREVRVAVNWGLAALLYGLVGGLIVRLLRR